MFRKRYKGPTFSAIEKVDLCITLIRSILYLQWWTVSGAVKLSCILIFTMHESLPHGIWLSIELFLIVIFTSAADRRVYITRGAFYSTFFFKPKVVNRQNIFHFYLRNCLIRATLNINVWINKIHNNRETYQHLFSRKRFYKWTPPYWSRVG